MMEAQRKVAESVARRGYRDGWTAAQFLARQVCKLVEELAEMSEQVADDWLTMTKRLRRYWPWQQQIIKAGIAARFYFDRDKDEWRSAHVLDLDALKAEAADMQVVLFALASANSEIDGQPWDVVAAAVDKAGADEGRGVR